MPGIKAFHAAQKTYKYEGLQFLGVNFVDMYVKWFLIFDWSNATWLIFTVRAH